MIYRLVLIAMLSLICANGWGKPNNTISGKVKEHDGKPVVSANVVLLTDSNRLVKAELTNEQGEYQFTAIQPGQYLIKVTLLGYADYTSGPVTLNANTQIPDIVLAEHATALKEVSVRAQKPFIELRADKLVVNVENSIVSAGASAMEVLQRSPGVTVDNNDNISLKGKPGVIIWIDGRPTPMAGTDLATVLRGMPANSIDKIEIISNPGARYDAAGNAGIINIRTKKDQRIGMNGSANVSYGQGVYPKYGAGINLNYRNKKVNVYGNYNYAMRYWFNHLMLNRRFDTTVNEVVRQLRRYYQDNYALFDFKNHIVNIGIDYSLSSKTTVGLALSGITNTFSPQADNASRAMDMNDNVVYRFYTTGRHHNFHYNYTANVYLRHQFDSSGRELTADLDYAAFGRDGEQNFVTTYQSMEGAEYRPAYYLRSDLNGLTQIRSVRADYRHPLKNKLTIEGGVKAAYVTADNEPLFYEKMNGEYALDPTRSNHFIYNENINAAYINASKDWTRWSLQLGLRSENTNAYWEQKTTNQKFDTSYVQLFPSFAVQYRLNDLNNLGVTLSRRIERPNYQQLNPFRYYIDATTYNEGYPYLKPASFYSLELTHTYRQKFITSFTYGVNRGIITEVIQPSDDEPGVTVQTNKNLDEMLFVGLSGSYSFEINRWWTNVTNYNIYYARYEGNIANTPIRNGRPTFDFNTNNSFLLPRNFSAELGGWYQARQLYAYMDVQPVWMLNVGIQKTFLDRAATIRLNIQDMFWTGFPRATSTYTDYQEHFEAERETRTVNIAFTYRFGKKTVVPSRRRAGGAEEEKRRAGTGT